MDTFFSELESATQGPEAVLEPVMNSAYRRELYLPEFKPEYTLVQVAAYERKIRQIIEEGFSLAVHTDYRHVPNEQQVALGVGDAIYTPKEKELMQGWDPIAAARRFDAAKCRLVLPQNYKTEKHDKDLQAFREAFGTPSLTHENLYWFKTQMPTYIELISAYKKKAVVAAGRKGGKLSHKLFAEYTTITALVGLCSARVQEIAVEYNELMKVHASSQEILALRKMVLKAAETGTPIDPKTLPGNRNRILLGKAPVTGNISFGSGQGKRKRPATAASVMFAAEGEDVQMSGIEEDLDAEVFESDPSVKAIERKVLELEKELRPPTENIERATAFAEITARMRNNPALEHEIRSIHWREARMVSARDPRQGAPMHYSKIQRMVVRVFNDTAQQCKVVAREARDNWEDEPLWDILYANFSWGPLVLGNTAIKDEATYKAIMESDTARTYPLKPTLDYDQLRAGWKEHYSRLFVSSEAEPSARELAGPVPSFFRAAAPAAGPSTAVAE